MEGVQYFTKLLPPSLPPSQDAPPHYPGDAPYPPPRDRLDDQTLATGRGGAISSTGPGTSTEGDCGRGSGSAAW